MLIAVLAERLGFIVGTVVALRLCWLTGASVGMGSGGCEGNLVGVGGESGNRKGKRMLDSIDDISLELMFLIPPPFHSARSSCLASA